MYINKLLFQKVEIDIINVSAPSYSQYKYYKNCPIQDTFWLNDADCLNQKEAYIIDDKCRITVKTTIQQGVRPIIRFVSSELQTGDEFEWGHHLFVVIEHGLAICTTVIGYSCYSKKNNISSYSASDLFHFIKNWTEQNIDKDVHKIIGTDNYFTRDKTASLLSIDETVHLSAPTLSRGRYSYWIKGRISEFTNAYIGRVGVVSAAETSQKLNIYPAIYFDINSLKKHFQEQEVFEYRGRLFEVINCNLGIALSLNTIGTSCFSTGISSIAEEDENEFYRNSEVHEIIQNWRKKEKEENLWK